MDSNLVLYIAVALQLLFAAAVGAGCVAAWRWTRAIWPPLSFLLGLGIVIRASAGLALFTVSYLNLPVLASLHTGDGFWHLAPDARAYYELAASAASGAPVPAGSPSPSFLETLGLWMWLAGESPASAVLFNLVLYVGICVMVIASFGPRRNETGKRGALVVIGAFTFSPVLILLGTQTLKDVFSAFLVVVVAVGVASMLSTSARTWFRHQTVWILACIAAAVYLMAGVRAYYALFLWTAVAAALLWRTASLPRRAVVRWAPFPVVVMVVLWCAFMWGAGPYYTYYGDLVTRTIGVELPLISPERDRTAVVPPSEGFGLDAARSSVGSLRQGFVRSGGATNLVGEESRGLSSLRAVLTGLAALFVPVSVLMQLSIVDFAGGRGFLLVTDLDTVFISATLLAVAGILIRSGSVVRRNLPFVAFALTLGTVSAVLIAYVVTNYGTLFRLRLLAVVPLWLLLLALRPTQEILIPGLAEGESRGDESGPAAGEAQAASSVGFPGGR